MSEAVLRRLPTLLGDRRILMLQLIIRWSLQVPPGHQRDANKWSAMYVFLIPLGGLAILIFLARDVSNGRINGQAYH